MREPRDVRKEAGMEAPTRAHEAVVMAIVAVVTVALVALAIWLGSAAFAALIAGTGIVAVVAYGWATDERIREARRLHH
jgi:hypothetical protein